MISDIVSFIMSILTTLFILLFVIEKRKNTNAVANTVKLLIFQEKEHSKNKTDKEQSNEDFLKFVSDSRDWAYQYIEDVQVAFTNFANTIEPDINRFDIYGDIMSAEPNFNSMKKISNSYKELKTVLPEVEDVPGNK